MLDSVSRARKQSGLPEECLPLLTTGNRADGKVEQVTEAFFGTAGPGGTPTPITREKIPSSESPDGEVGRALQQQAAQTVLVEEKARLAKQKKSYCQKLLDGERASLGLLRASVSPQLQPEYASLEEELSSLSDGLSQEQSSVDDFSQKLSTFQARRASFDELFVEDLRQELNIPSSAEAKEIFRGLISGWQGFVLPTEHPGIVQQNHMIKGLKIYLLPGTDILVADYSTKRFAATGTYKQVKSITRIGYGQEGEGSQKLIRLTSVSKTEKAVSWFGGDIKKEWNARIALSEAHVPNIAGMTCIQYLNKKGVLKTRYFMTRYISSVNALSGGPKEIFYAIDVAESLAAVHRGGLVHGDIKGANVLTDGRKGFLTDFGLMSRVGRALTYDVGAVGYMAPETLFEPHRHKRVSTQESDMFSFGLLLLGLVDLNKRLSWERSVKDLDQTYGERLRALITTQFEAEDKYRKGLAAITEKERSSGEDLSQSKEQLRVECSRTVNMAGQEKLKLCEEFKRAYRAVHEKLIINVTHSFKPYSLIQELLSIDPKQRPTAEEALKRLNEMYPRSPKAPV